jgi:hypothetical protein
MTSVLQPTFAAGEISPSASARTDIARYFTGLKLCRNFMVMPYGGVRNRPGTKFVCEVKDSTKLCRLIPFQFNDVQTYVLQFGDQNVRVIKDGGQVLDSIVQFLKNGTFDTDIANWTTLSGAPAWDAGRIRLVSLVAGACRVTQQITGLIVGVRYTYTFTITANGSFQVGTASGTGDLVSLALGGVTRTGTFVATQTTAWITLSNNGSPGSDTWFDNITIVGKTNDQSQIIYAYELAIPYGQDDLAQLNYTQSADVMTIAHPSYKPRELSRLAHDNWTTAEINLAPRIAAPASATATTLGGTGVQQTWRYQVTAVLDDGNTIDESLPVTSGTVNVFADTMAAKVVWPAVTGASYYIVYKDNAGAGIYGFIGRATALEFTDRNITATKNDTPPNGNDPFVGANKYPGAVGYYQQRLVFAGSNDNPQTVWMSKTGLFKNFGYSIPNKDDDAITFTIASTQVNRMRHLLGLKKLLGLTTGGEWVFSGADTGLSAKTVQASQEGYDGSAVVPPVVVGNSAVYVQARGNRVSSFGYSLNADGFAATDLTIFSAHLFRGHTLTNVAYQKIPDSIVWYVRSDGKLLGLTYLPDQQLVGWHWHDTDGFVESIACIPEGQEDALYMVVRRTVNGVQRRYVERMVSRQMLSVEDSFFVDSGLTYDGRNSDTGKTLAITGGSTWKSPEVVTLTAAGHAPFTAASIGVRYALTRVIEEYDSDPVTSIVRVEVVGYTSPTVVTAKLLIVCPDVLRGVVTSTWSRQVKTLSGLGHLEGKQVSILADGNVQPQKVVIAGSVTLQSHAGIVHVGLPYLSDMETLDIESKDARETMLDKKIAVTRLTVVVEESRGIFAGADKDQLYEHKPGRDSYELPIELLTGQAAINIPNDWSGKGRVFIRQADPLPLTVLAVIPEVTFGGS